jgi:hypothetical protein
LVIVLRAVEDDLDIIGIAESWLTDSIEQAEVAIDGYKTFRKDRSEVKTGKGGGVILYVKKEILMCECVFLNKAKLESVWSKILSDAVKGHVLPVGGCYKSPNADGNEVEELFKVIEKAADDKVLIMGDFNFPGINWDTLESGTNAIEFKDQVMDNYLIQHVHEPTRESNILDLVLTSSD